MRKLAKVLGLIVLFIILSFGAWVGYVFRFYTVPILMYHYVNDDEAVRSRLGISPATFERQMRFLKEHRYNVLTLEEAAKLAGQKKKIPPKTVAITFDDGYEDNFTNAYPILKKYNLPAAIFVVVDRVGRILGNDKYMDWQQIKELSDSGLITIGSHSITHPNLSEILDKEELKKEIFDSKRIIEQNLGKKVNLFSYPFGGINLSARNHVIGAGYQAAVGTNFPRNYPGDDIFALKRIRISETSRNLFCFWVVVSGHYTYIKEHRDSY